MKSEFAENTAFVSNKSQNLRLSYQTNDNDKVILTAKTEDNRVEDPYFSKSDSTEISNDDLFKLVKTVKIQREFRKYKEKNVTNDKIIYKN